jgi:transcriptional regulator
MYIPPHFKEDRPEILHAAIRAANIATLVTHSAEGLEANPLPMLLDPEAPPHGALIAHFARANPQWRHAAAGVEALAIFHGPDAYISPSFYPSKAEHGRVVPTWNYVTVHVHGTLRAVEDAEGLHAIVSALTRHHEAPRATRGLSAWAVTDAPPDFVSAQLRGIVGVVLQITRIEGKWKMSQNRNAADRAGVVAGLSASNNTADHDVAHLVPR